MYFNLAGYFRQKFLQELFTESAKVLGSEISAGNTGDQIQANIKMKFICRILRQKFLYVKILLAEISAYICQGSRNFCMIIVGKIYFYRCLSSLAAAGKKIFK